MQLTHVLNKRLKELIEDAEREKALKDVAATMAKEKGKNVEAVEKRVQLAKKAWLVSEKKLNEVEVKLGSTKLKLAEEKSLNLAQANEIVDPKAALDAYEEKWYNEGFADAENSMEPIIHQARLHGFEEGWLAAL